MPEHDIHSLAKEILILARNTLLVNMRFLDSALSRLELCDLVQNEIPLDITAGTEGQKLYYSPKFILRKYKTDKNAVAHIYLHIIMHCIFRHMFIHTLVDNAKWDLACDIAVESVISGLRLNCIHTDNDTHISDVLSDIEKRAGKLTAEKIYRYLLDGNVSENKMREWRNIFTFDDHSIWYMTESQRQNIGISGGRSRDNGSVISVNGCENDNKNNNPASVGSFANGNNDQFESNKKNSGSNSNTGNFRSDNYPENGSEDDWKSVSERIQMDMETFSSKQGDTAGNMLQNLKEINRERHDYTAFLKKFAVRGEVMKVNDDEVDYIFYTYGLKLYEKMPLIEPLEYKEVKRIREFVIAIDTSDSVSGKLVQTFLQKTYNILMSTESFFSRVNIHIIQCDAEIQADKKITSQAEFDEYLKTMKIRGLGGTDFRPVFEYVDRLQHEKELTNLKGLIYFTDGYGTFPARKPEYDAAFIFIDDEYNNPDVPPWAIKLILRKDEV